MTSINDMHYDPLKCMFMGLQNSGKTSILNILKGKFAQSGNMTAQLLKLQPTVRIERNAITLLGLPIKVWDMGGQEQYRQEYLLRQQYFDRINLLIYVVDIQDAVRFQESFGYFINILEIIVDLCLDPHILVFFHKSDPEVRDSPELLKICQEL